MKKYQLIGRKKIFDRKPNHINVTYSTNHLISLPLEILLIIFDQINFTDYINISLTCKKLKNLIYKFFLYYLISFTSSEKFYLFAINHLPLWKNSRLGKRLGLNDVSSQINYIHHVTFVNPPKCKTDSESIKIAGSYDIESIKQRNDFLDYNEFVENFTTLLKEGYGIKSLTINEISPHFSFPSVLIKKYTGLFRKSPVSRSLDVLKLSTQSGWSLPFKFEHISTIVSVFDNINELTLHNFIIEENKLLTGAQNVNLSINNLVLNSCKFIPTTKKREKIASNHDIFTSVKHLHLINLNSGTDLSTIDFVKFRNNHLNELTIDLGSKIFFDCRNENTRIFNFTKFNGFFKLVCSGNSYTNFEYLNLINFDLFDKSGKMLNVDQTPTDDWINNEDLNSLLKNLNTIPNLRIKFKNRDYLQYQVCRNCGAENYHKHNEEELEVKCLEQLTKVLEPLLVNEKLNLTIIDSNDSVLFTRVH